MSTTLVLFVLVSLLLSLGLSWYQYNAIPGADKKLRLLFIALRAVTYFILSILLFNPKVTRETFELVKPKLVLLADNSESISHLNGTTAIETNIEILKEDAEITAKFDLSSQIFDATLKSNQPLTFTAASTDIAKALSTIANTHMGQQTAVVLMSDGNPTKGISLEYLEARNDMVVFPVIVGDTTQMTDLEILTLNTNKYAFLNNYFPIEVTVKYNGKSAIDSELSIYIEGKKASSQRLTLSPDTKTKKLDFKIKASTVGLKLVTASLSTKLSEANVENNKKFTAIEILGQQQQVGYVTEHIHPDLGSLTKALNKDSTKEIIYINPQRNKELPDDLGFLVFYHPTKSMDRLLKQAISKNLGMLFVFGEEADTNWFNQAQNWVEFDPTQVVSEIEPVVNKDFRVFNIENLDLLGYPPLKGDLGKINFKAPYQILLKQKIRGEVLEKPLLAIIESDNQRVGFVLGQNFWRWRLEEYRRNQSFEGFDNMFSKLNFYLSNTEKRERLEVDYKPIYENANETLISVVFYDQGFEPVPNASLKIIVKDSLNQVIREAPMVAENSKSTIHLSDLKSGNYQFQVVEETTKMAKSGKFTVLSYNPELRFSNANIQGMTNLAQGNNTSLFYAHQADNLKKALIEDSRFNIIQKSIKKTEPLIAYHWLLAVLVLFLTAEWLVRKYNGLL